MRYWTAGLIALTLLTAPLGADDEKYQVQFQVGWGGCYRPMHWTAVQVDITCENLQEPYQGFVRLSADQDELNTLIIRHPVVISPNTTLRLPLATKFAFGASDCEVSIEDDRSRRRFRQSWDLWNYGHGMQSIQPVGLNELLIGVVEYGGFGLGTLSDRSRCIHPYGSDGRVFVKHKQLDVMPWDWTGYDTLDALVLYNPDWVSMKPHQAEAVAEWVRGGGHLMVVLGSNPLPARHPVASLIPYRIGSSRRVQLAAETLEQLGFAKRPSQGAAVTIWPLEGESPSGWTQIVSGPGLPLVATGPAGFGRVSVLPFSPQSLQAAIDNNAESKARFWVARLNELLSGKRSIEYSSSEPSHYSSDMHYYELGESSGAVNSVLEHLLSIPELRPLSIWVVVLLLLGLAVLLGPVDYLVLKKLDRLPLTWITSGATIVVFSVGAYYGVEALRAGKMQVRAVSVIDSVDGRSAWKTVYAGIFAPTSDDYVPEGLSDNEWWSAVSPTRSDTLYSYGHASVTRRLYCIQSDGSNRPSSVPINIWSMQCLLCEASTDEIPVEATVTVNGDHAEVVIVNHADVPITGGQVRVSSTRWLPLGEVPAGGQRTFSSTLRRGGYWESSHATPYGYTGPPAISRVIASSFRTPPTQPRTEAFERMLEAGTSVVCVQYRRPDVWFDISGRSGEGDHLQIVRLAVQPKEASE
ncbi:MAG: hypothetical protein ACP5HU_04255 [Phycisphaerae bacterium]